MNQLRVGAGVGKARGVKAKQPPGSYVGGLVSERE